MIIDRTANYERDEGDQGTKGQGDKGKITITHYPLPITHYPLPITHYPLPITQSPIPNP